MLGSLYRELERGVATNANSGVKAELLHMTDPSTSLLKRKASVGMLKFAQTQPDAAKSMLSRVAKNRGVEYLGAGFDCSVYRQDSLALKVFRRSVAASRPQQEAIIGKQLTHSTLLRKFLGTMVLRQDMAIRPHPVFGDVQTVQGLQKYVDFANNEMPFDFDQPSIDLIRLGRLVSAYPGIDEGLHDLVSASARMLDQSGRLPDTNGPNNLVTGPGGTVTLIDLTTIGPETPGVLALVNQQLTSLEYGLREVV